MNFFRFSCPIIPLLPDGKGYPQNFQLPKRQRYADALNLPQLTQIFRESIIYESINETDDNQISDLAVLNVLSPYSLLCHVMVCELSPNRFLPGPESFTKSEWLKFSELSHKVFKSMNLVHQKNHTKNCFSTFCGFNWSPYSWGLYEERGGCQSITTKFHLMIWQWPQITKTSQCDILPEKHRQIFLENNYNESFGKLIGKSLGYKSFEVGPRGIFIPFETITSDLIYELKGISEKVEKIIHNLNSILISNFNEAFNEVKQTMEESSHRVISDDEINTKLRYNNLELNSLHDAISKCENEDEKQIINSIYHSVVNRVELNSNHNSKDFDNKDIWEKFFGFSLVLAESFNNNDIKSGLYIGLHPLCGPGGCAEVLGCYLTRPEQRMADEKDMIEHNHQIWLLKEELEK